VRSGRRAIKAQLAKAEGDKALRDGNDQAAAVHFRAAVVAYDSISALGPPASMTPRWRTMASTKPPAPLARSSVASIVSTAVDLSPGDPVLMFNAAGALLSGALADVAATEIDLRLLRETGSTSLLGYLYNDESSRQGAGHAREGASRRGAGGFVPGKADDPVAEGLPAVHVLLDFHSFTRNEAALVALETARPRRGHGYL
jgi:hypothetical protein